MSMCVGACCWRSTLDLTPQDLPSLSFEARFLSRPWGSAVRLGRLASGLSVSALPAGVTVVLQTAHLGFHVHAGLRHRSL